MALDEARLQKEKEMDYVEAERLRKQIVKLKTQLEQFRKSSLQYRHIEQRKRLDQEHEKKIREFDQEWEKKITDFLVSSDEILQKTVEKHAVELLDYQKELEFTVMPTTKKTAGMLNAEVMMRSIAKTQNYTDAIFLKEKLMRATLDNNTKHDGSKKDRIAKLIAHKKKMQRHEIEATKFKIQAGLAE